MCKTTLLNKNSSIDRRELSVAHYAPAATAASAVADIAGSSAAAAAAASAARHLFDFCAVGSTAVTATGTSVADESTIVRATPFCNIPFHVRKLF
mmetsp:Transcript_22381/g.49013  ORF Transcript_22381/g.49013 Transcript_22381/m.49013 type:complete len:95 (-) Transcript_22381:128-412(-)